MKKRLACPRFRPEASQAKDGVAMVFDVCGFSTFFNKPDVHKYVPKYLNHISSALDICIYGGDPYWQHKPRCYEPLSILPSHRKFLGDGALYIWASKDLAETAHEFSVLLANRLWSLQHNFKQVNLACADHFPVVDLPSSIRIGLARGTVYELSVQESRQKEYIGVCVNLASRLQKYSAGLNFIASARLDLPQSELRRHGYMKVVATKIKGFPKEVVIVDKDEHGTLDAEVRRNLFMPFRSSPSCLRQPWTKSSSRH